jgi:hypothetical protein
MISGDASQAGVPGLPGAARRLAGDVLVAVVLGVAWLGRDLALPWPVRAAMATSAVLQLKVHDATLSIVLPLYSLASSPSQGTDPGYTASTLVLALLLLLLCS